MRIASGDNGSFLRNEDYGGLLAKEKGPKISPEIELLSRRSNVDPDIMRRAYDREDEERDLRVLDAYNRFEGGLQEILTTPETGIMFREAGAAQSAVFEVNDYFSGEGGRLCDELPDDECRERFMDILESRRRTAINAVAQHQSQEYQKWKDRTASDTINAVLKAVNISPDAASLMHGEKLLEGAVLRLYRGSDPELLALRLSSAKQAMYGGALESIGASDPVTGLIVLESWREQLGEHNYEQLKEKFGPMARNQSLKMEFASLRNLDDAQLQGELEDIVDQEMREEIYALIMADRKRLEDENKKAAAKRLNMISHGLFQRFAQDMLTVEDIVDSGLSPEKRAIWQLIFSGEQDTGEDRALLDVVESIISTEIGEEYEIYEALARGLGRVDASLLSTLFRLKDNPESRLMVNAFHEIAEANETTGGDEGDHAAALRDFLHRTVVLLSKGDPFSITSLRNDILDDHFGGRKTTSGSMKAESGEKEQSVSESPADIERGKDADEVVQGMAAEGP